MEADEMAQESAEVVASGDSSLGSMANTDDSHPQSPTEVFESLDRALRGNERFDDELVGIITDNILTDTPPSDNVETALQRILRLAKRRAASQLSEEDA